MACTTILVGKNASYDGSTMIARNDDSGAGHYMPKKFVVVHPEERQKVYRSVISHVEIELPDNPLRCTSMPNAVDGEGIWAASGVNAKNVAMTATETITSNPRVLGADPLVVYEPAKDGKEEKAGEKAPCLCHKCRQIKIEHAEQTCRECKKACRTERNNSCEKNDFFISHFIYPEKSLLSQGY